MEAAHDMSVSCFQFISLSSLGKFMKPAYSLYENSSSLFYLLL